MTNEQINRAIAETCGWKMQDHLDCVAKKVGWQMPEKWILRPDGMLVFKHDVPNYCKCLNAMHEAERILGNRLSEYGNHLYKMTLVNQSDLPECYIWHVTARQRAEAFLRAIGKWEEVQA